MGSIQTKFKLLAAEVNEQHYYPQLFAEILVAHDMGPDGIASESYEDKKIIHMCHDFWEALPDSPSIRREPFFALCNIAERIFD
ncbi:hypothetical protein [Acinetobacter sp.]|uniref:hypothetical protein n=1 Tax=Acinetobacter sp. TaxID=472 RepID=UPI00388EB4DF